MFVVTKEIQMDVAHRVPQHKSKCRNVHGHRYRVVVAAGISELQSEGSNEGMVVDFGDLKALMMKHIHDVYDHGAIFYVHDPMAQVIWDALDESDLSQELLDRYFLVEFVPTAENLARHFFDRIVEAIGDTQLWWIEYVEVWETPTSMARYQT